MDEGMIPIAVDYGCDTGKCSGKFKPLDSSYSYDAKDVLNLMMDPQNPIASSNAKRDNNAIGFGKTDKGLVKFSFNEIDSVVKGALCGHIFNEEDKKFGVLYIECDTIAY